MIEARTESGFSFVFDEDAADDMELLEKIAKLDKGDFLALSEILETVIGHDQKEALYNYCRTEKGKVSARRVMREFKSIFEAASAESKKIKN